MADRTAIKIGKRRAFEAMFTDSADPAVKGDAAKIDGSAVVAVTDPLRGALEEVADLLNPNGNGDVVGATGFLRILQAGDVDVQVTGHDADTDEDTTLIGQATGIAGDVHGGTFGFSGADVD